MLLPGCEAVMVHVPASSSVALLADTVQTAAVEEANVTGKPEVARAESASVVPAGCAAMTPKVIVCGSGLTVKLCETGVAAA